MSRLPFLDADPAHTGYQYLEHLATGYWYSEVLFAALNLKIFDLLHPDGQQTSTLASRAGCDPAALTRLLAVLDRLELVGQDNGNWYNMQPASRWLVSSSPLYLGDFLLYRQYMKTGWEKIVARVSGNAAPQDPPAAPDADYRLRNFRYVQAMDVLAREKASEIVQLIPEGSWHPPLLDIGGGAGALARALIHTRADGDACLFELEEVIQAARRIYPQQAAWQRITPLCGDFRTHRFASGQKFGLVVMGNFLHAYGPQEARTLLSKAVSLLTSEGMVVVHDYFPDMAGAAPQKGALYDLNMMLNTYDGVCHSAREVTQWLGDAGMTTIWRRPLSTDSAVILAAGPAGALPWAPVDPLPQAALALGFQRAVELPAEAVVTASWVSLKCRHGCALYGKKRQCPPHCMPLEETRRLLKAYRRVLVVEGTPPGKAFHEQLLALERRAFLDGYRKAFVFGAGPCPLCGACPPDGVCRHPDKARPAMEAAGMDVYAIAEKAGLRLRPVPAKGDYVKYIGLLLIE